MQEPWSPSPRTPYSSRSVLDLSMWFRFHETLSRDAARSAERTKILLLGDSITESFRGTSMGQHCERCKGVPLVLRAAYGEEALALGISGDQTQHLLWRMHHGEMPVQLQPKVIVLLIGTNNLGAGMSPEDTLIGIKAVIDAVRSKRQMTHILLLGLFPRRKSKSLAEPLKQIQQVIACGPFPTCFLTLVNSLTPGKCSSRGRGREITFCRPRGEPNSVSGLRRGVP